MCYIDAGTKLLGATDVEYMGNRLSVKHAVNWSVIDVVVRQGLNIVVFILLARLLAPSDFGLVAMLALFVAIAGLLVDSGFSQALIQRQGITPIDESTVFFFTLAMGALIALIMCALAPWIAVFYNQPQLEQMTYWMALNLFLNAFGTIHTTLLTKKLDFKTITIAGVVATVISGCVAIFMVVQGWGVWSLVGQVLASTVSMVFMLWMLHSWRPKRAFSISSLRSFFRFGGFLLWIGLFNTLYTNLYALLIGKLHTVQDVGYYSQAQRLQQLPVNIITNVVGRVAFPVFSIVAEDKAKLARGLRKGLTFIMFINIPLMLGLMMLAKPLVLTLLGAKWLPSASVLQVLSLAGLMWPLHALNINVLKAQGHSALMARIQIIKLSVAILLLLITSPFGILSIAYGEVVSSLLSFVINAHYSKKFLDYGGYTQLRDVFPYVVATFPMIVCIWGLDLVQWLPAQIKLIVAMLVGSVIYLLTCKLAKLSALEEIMLMLRKHRA